MEIFITIDGVLRNTLQKFDTQYREYYLESDPEDKEETFVYDVTGQSTFDTILDFYKFQSKEEYMKFLYFEFPVEIFGHATLSYPLAATDFNKLFYDYPDINFTIIGLNEKGKAKPATLFFLSKVGIICDNIRFSTIDNIKKLWKECDVWITDDKRIIDACPKYRFEEKKYPIKFNTIYNNHFTNKREINKLSEIDKTWKKSLEKTISSTSME